MRYCPKCYEVYENEAKQCKSCKALTEEVTITEAAQQRLFGDDAGQAAHDHISYLARIYQDKTRAAQRAEDALKAKASEKDRAGLELMAFVKRNRPGPLAGPVLAGIEAPPQSKRRRNAN
jgi:hypothetical protein